jgi:hypothetical protein
MKIVFIVENVGVGEDGLDACGGHHVAAFEAFVDEVYPLNRGLLRGDIYQLLQLLEIRVFVRFQLLIQVTIQLDIGQ